ncbi:hypothetical protein [Streptomyces tauricus]|uniref:hypothetical protein n=1 Tax=Streptomyces tauricus TaxID=68274 RepID=UPI003431E7DE
MTAQPTPDPTPETPPGDRQRDSRGKFERSMDTVARDARAAELRAEGRTYQQIADELDLSHKGDAWRAVRNARADVARPAVTKLIATESAELDDLYVMAREVIDANHVVVSHGKVVTMLDPDTGEEKPLTDNGPKLQAIQTALRIRQAYQDLHGLKQPVQVAVSGSVRYEVVGVDTSDLT